MGAVYRVSKEGIMDSIKVGSRFGRLKVVAFSCSTPNGKKWFVQCNCGSQRRENFGTDLRLGKSTSCGCSRRVSHKIKRARVARRIEKLLKEVRMLVRNRGRK